MNQRSRAAIFGRIGRVAGAVHFSRVCCSARMHEDDARWPTVHTTGALSDGTPPDFDAGIRWQADRKKGNAASAIRCLLVSFSPGMLAVMPQLHPNRCQPSELSSVPSPTPPIRARSSLSARLPGLPSRWPAYFFVRPRGTCTARAAVVGCCARPWGRITLQWRNGAPPGPFERRDVSVLGRPASVMRARRTACTYPSAAKAYTVCCCVRIYMEGARI